MQLSSRNLLQVYDGIGYQEDFWTDYNAIRYERREATKREKNRVIPNPQKGIIYRMYQ